MKNRIVSVIKSIRREYSGDKNHKTERAIQEALYNLRLFCDFNEMDFCALVRESFDTYSEMKAAFTDEALAQEYRIK